MAVVRCDFASMPTRVMGGSGIIVGRDYPSVRTFLTKDTKDTKGLSFLQLQMQKELAIAGRAGDR